MGKQRKRSKKATTVMNLDDKVQEIMQSLAATMHRDNGDSSNQSRQVIEEDILTTRNIIHAFSERLQDLNESLNTTSSIMKCLPLEVLTEIFFTINESDGRDPRKTEILPVPFLLGRVCRAWRKIVWGTPRLWSILPIHLTEKREEAQRQLLQDWIGRSASHPLEVYVRIIRKTTYPPWKPQPETLRLLLDVCNRWKSLDLCHEFHNWLASEFKASRPHTTFPMLYKIIFSRGRSDSISKRLLEYSPRLRSIGLGEIFTQDRFRFNWGMLHHLETFGGVEACLSIFEVARLLRTCILHFLDLTRDPDVDLNRVRSMPFLTMLALRTNGTHTDFYAFLKCISLPALTSLKLNIVSSEKDWGPHLTDMIHRSRCQLTELILVQPAIPEDEIMDILRLLPSLKRLLMIAKNKDPPISDSIINLLNPAASSREGRPTIECLPSFTIFSYEGYLVFTFDAVIAMLKARMEWAQRDKGSGRDFCEVELNDAPTVRQLQSVTIRYNNADWGQKEDPNTLRTFYLDLAAMAPPGTSVDRGGYVIVNAFDSTK